MIDKNRALVQRTTAAGISVHEFKDAPGEYFDVNGQPVADHLAEEAGFDIVGGRKEKRRRELYAKKQAEIDAELEREFREIDAKVAAEPEAPVTEQYKAEKRGSAYVVLDLRGAEVANGLSKREADALVKDFNEGLAAKAS